MANQTTSNPKVFDSAGTITGLFGLRLLQWVDLNEDIVDGDTLKFDVNGVTLEAEIQKDVTAGQVDSGAVMWEIGPFNPAIACHDFSLTTIDSGAVHVWVG